MLKVGARSELFCGVVNKDASYMPLCYPRIYRYLTLVYALIRPMNMPLFNPRICRSMTHVYAVLRPMNMPFCDP